MPFISSWIEPEVLVDDRAKRIQIRRVYDGQTAEDPLFWHFAVSAGENYDDVDSDWENDCKHYDVRDMPGYYDAPFLSDLPTVLDPDMQLFLKSLIESGHITPEWDK